MPQKRISIWTSWSVGSRRGIVVGASGEVALAAEYALASRLVRGWSTDACGDFRVCLVIISPITVVLKFG
jgi:hypothetical protein